MKKTQLKEILSCLKGERTVFQYSRDMYALNLVQDVIGEGLLIAKLRQSAYANLLNKPLLKQALALAGDGVLRPAHLEMVRWQHQPLNFVLTLSNWGSTKTCYREYCQMSRTGYQLVLQLNFANDHQQQYQRWLKDTYQAEFSCWQHPVVKRGKYETLAWARIDLDFTANQALIEEVQSDWVRQVKDRWAAHCFGQKNMLNYRHRVLKPYVKIWDEAILAASLQLIRHELGIKEVFYHSFEMGNAMKGIGNYSQPPRSLYTDLPRKFAFRKTNKAPAFLKGLHRTRKAIHELKEQAYWFNLST